jgi:capsular polysaccharide biosynthesis protein
VLSIYDGDYLPERPGADGYLYLEDGTADLSSGLTTVSFIRATLRRTARLWCVIAVAGMFAGLGIAVTFPPAYEATTSLLLTPVQSPDEAADEPILNEQAIAQSRAVAELAMQKLGLHEDVSSFLSSYTVLVATDRILTITVSASSAGAAVNRASVIAAEYLRFRANMAETELNLTNKSLEQQVSRAQANVASINTQISVLSAQPASYLQQAKLTDLKMEASQATLALGTLQGTNADNAATAQLSNDLVMQDSQVLNPAALVPHARLKRVLLYTVMGLIAALVLSMGIIVAGALVSDRLRRRDDIARALAAPVTISAGTVRPSRWRPGRRGLAIARNTDVRRIVAYLDSSVAYLDSAVPSGQDGPASLAVVPVGDVRVAAICLASLAASCARQGKQVVLADLCDGAPAARLLRATKTGVQTAGTRDTQVTVVVPERDRQIAPGPLRREPDQPRAAEPVVTACEAADVLLTLATLDPSLGATHLAGWAGDAIVVVTAGESSAALIHAVGEMIRLAGMNLISAVLVGADKTDESLGTTFARAGGDGVTEESSQLDAQGLFAAADGPPGGRLPDD